MILNYYKKIMEKCWRALQGENIGCWLHSRKHGSSIRDEDNVAQKVVKIRNGPEYQRTSAREREREREDIAAPAETARVRDKTALL